MVPNQQVALGEDKSYMRLLQAISAQKYDLLLFMSFVVLASSVLIRA